jgi:two-component system sensor histidine kinase DesK
VTETDTARSGPWQWPAEGQVRSPGQQSNAARLRGHFVVVLLLVVLPLITVHLSGRPSALRWALLIADLVVYTVSFLLVTQLGQRRSHRTRILMVVWLMLLGALLPVVTQDLSTLGQMSYAIVAAVVLLPAQASRLVGLGIALVQVIATRLVDGRVDWNGTVLLVLLTLALSSLFALTRTVSQLNAARSLIAHQSVVDERNRLARDLHDVLGHTVATIAVKSGVARRMLETDAGRDAVRGEVRDIEELSRKAMEEIRSTVLDTRTVSLDDELANVAVGLRTAGIDAVLPETGEPVRSDLREVFAYVLREGVTNVLKHSGARRCEVRLGPTWIEVEDDGRGRRFDLDAWALDAWTEVAGGNGLLGLAERLRAVGGGLRAGRVRSGGFLLRAAVDAARPDSARARRPRSRIRGRSRRP